MIKNANKFYEARKFTVKEQEMDINWESNLILRAVMQGAKSENMHKRSEYRTPEIQIHLLTSVFSVQLNCNRN